jgi:hypothetical protein
MWRRQRRGGGAEFVIGHLISDPFFFFSFSFLFFLTKPN